MTTDGGIWGAMSWPPGWDVRHVAETGSTNADLIAGVIAGTASNRTVLAADHQTAGRGRLDRRWEAPPGANLLVSMVVEPVPEVPADATHRLGLAVVAAVRRFVEDVDGVGLKWPNDVMIGERKLAGILAQRVPDRDAVVVGVGLNVGWAPEGAVAIRTGVQRAAVSPAEVLHAILEEHDALPADVSAQYLAALTTIGRWVRVELPGDVSPLHGRAVAVDDTGRLVVVDASGRRHDLDVGDIVHVRAVHGESSV